jgi:hypothetical protein
MYTGSNGSGSNGAVCANLTNLATITGPCSGSWNDCVDSVRVKLASTHCLSLYRAAGYENLMVTYWGAENEVLHNLPQINVLSSLRFHRKVSNSCLGGPV